MAISDWSFVSYKKQKRSVEARAKLEMSSNLADEPTLANVLPPCKTAREKTKVFCLSILSMRTHSKQSIDENMTGDVLLPHKTAREKNELFAYLYHQ